MVLGVLILFSVSLIWFLFPPKKINNVFGYRTRRSKKSVTHWKVANRISSGLFLILSSICLLEGIVLQVLALEELEWVIFTTFIIGLVIIFVITEQKLKEIAN